MQPQQQIWSKRVLVPFWIVQSIGFAIILIVACLGFSVIKDIDSNDTLTSEYDGQTLDDAERLLKIGAGILLGLSVVSIILNITEIVLYARKRLTPTIHLSSVCVKTVLWVFYFILTAIGAARGSGVGFILAIALVATCLGQLIYGSVIVHRKRKGKLNVVTEEYGMAPTACGGAPKWGSAPEQSYSAVPSAYATQQPAFGRA
ncbi:hypothetical protein B0A48_07229 [Cryoendolithus antarcticus]|uniref:Uncharacterized protein n=1 Tax=Cryoendolithus antarcticus TaxID=1507870 RepID=A0A1V8T8M6_9PEZI|nr:hypothetical protein B0A48_07229 [Cryoendolithus antarcticus]